ncbi:Gfo/Idh/MocA family protein, partial [Jiangella asiatica]
MRLPSGAAVPDMYLWASLLRRLENQPGSGVPVRGARVVSIWSEDHTDAQRVARACQIDSICATPEEVCDGVDAVMILSERPETHLPYARAALERGLRTYVDKPLADTPDAAREIFTLAERHGAPCYTGSAVRWSPEFLAAREHIRTKPNRAKALHVQCPLGLDLYGIHAIELANLFLGHDVDTIHTTTGPDRQIVLLTYTNGATALLDHLNFLRWPTYAATIHADTWHHHVTLDDPAPTLLAFTRTFADFANGAPPPVNPQESLHLINILTTTQRS